MVPPPGVFVPMVARLGRVPTVAVRKHGDRLALTIDLPAGLSSVDEEAIVTWAVRAVREHDPHTSTADAVVHRRSS